MLCFEAYKIIGGGVTEKRFVGFVGCRGTDMGSLFHWSNIALRAKPGASECLSAENSTLRR
jgi:hypothetical protein